MNKRKKNAPQRSHSASAVRQRNERRQPQHHTTGAAHRLHLLPPLGSVFEPPLTARYRVTVLLTGIWSSLHELLRRQAAPEIESDALHALDTLVEIAAPILAQQALHRHFLEHGRVYRQLGLRALWCQLLPAIERQAAPIWGELTPEDIVPELAIVLATATEARATMPQIPTNIFWPLMGAFFSAVDNSPHVSAQSWERIRAHPKQYTLISLLVRVRYGAATAGVHDNELPATDHDSAWQYCQSCGRASQKAEYIRWESRQLCPYGCNGQIGWDTVDWEEMRVVNPMLPVVPRRWMTYSPDNLEHCEEHDGTWS